MRAPTRERRCWRDSRPLIAPGKALPLPLLIKSQFPGLDPIRYAFLGPLLGALTRPVGGWIADEIGGARVTFWNFVVMSAAVLGVLRYLPRPGASGDFTSFLAAFILIFITTGIGNGATFRMIPVIFLTERQRAAGEGAQPAQRAVTEAGKEAAAVLGFCSAFAAYGAFFIPKAFGSSLAHTGTPDAAFYGFLAFYGTCIVLTWYFYSRKNADIPC